MIVERFLEQLPPVTAALMDPRLKKSEDSKRLQKVTYEDIHNGEDFFECYEGNGVMLKKKKKKKWVA